MHWKRTVLGLAIMGFVLAGGRAEAAPIFYLGPGPNPAGDVAFQLAVGAVSEDDMDSYAIGDLTSIILGGVTVSFSGEIFAGAFSPPGVYGTVFNNALLNRFGNVASPTGITFSFNIPIQAFGLWVFDNNQDHLDHVSMTVNGSTSNDLDGNPGAAHGVEGFIGVQDLAGFTSLTINHFSPTGGQYIELDHLQLAVTASPTPVPEPASLTLVGLGSIAAGAIRRRRRKA